MTRCHLALILLFLAAPARADKPEAKAEPKPLLETWQAAYFEGLKVGHVHTLARRSGDGDDAAIRTVRTMHLLIKRYGSVLPISIEQSSVEKADGKVLDLGLVQQLGKSPKVAYTGRVEGGNLVLKVGDDEARKLPFDDRSLGVYAQEVFFQKKKAKPGDKLSLVSYEIMLPGTMTLRAVVKDTEKVDQLTEKKAEDGKSHVVRTPVSLLRVEVAHDPINIGGTEVKLPGKTVWLDGKLLPVREQFDMPGLGVITLYNTTRDAALKEGVAPDRLPDFGLSINIPVKQTIDDPYKTTRAVYRVTTKEKMGKVFASDDRQKVGEAKDNTFELVVEARREPGTDDKAAPPGKEYLQSNTFLDSDDERIQALARAVTRKEGDPWKKALLLEKWVHDNMKVSSAVGFPSASRIARDLEGDCRQHALLLAALCRAAGVPARTAIGLLYVREPGRSPFFGFHMWAEVWVRGKWVALDAILGEGGVAATHLKMLDHNWSKTQTLAPLLPVSQVLGKLQIEVVSAK
jgi:transglutaminase-like putative cysteine protease